SFAHFVCADGGSDFADLFYAETAERPLHQCGTFTGKGRFYQKKAERFRGKAGALGGGCSGTPAAFVYSGQLLFVAEGGNQSLFQSDSARQCRQPCAGRSALCADDSVADRADPCAI